MKDALATHYKGDEPGKHRNLHSGLRFSVLCFVRLHKHIGKYRRERYSRDDKEQRRVVVPEHLVHVEHREWERNPGEQDDGAGQPPRCRRTCDKRERHDPSLQIARFVFQVLVDFTSGREQECEWNRGDDRPKEFCMDATCIELEKMLYGKKQGRCTQERDRHVFQKWNMLEPLIVGDEE